MYVLISFMLAVIPALLLVFYYYRQDRNKPEPKGLVIKIFLLGIASVIPVIVIELSLSLFLELPWLDLPFIAPLFQAFIVAAVVEEGAKLLVVTKFAYNQVAFDEEMDGIVYTVMAGMGFACTENVLYVIDADLSVALLRAVSAVPMHAFVAGIMGFYIGRAKFSPDPQTAKALFRQGFFQAVLYHGLYDFLLFALPDMVAAVGDLGVLLGFGIFPLLLYVFFRLRRLIKSALTDDRDHERENKSP